MERREAPAFSQRGRGKTGGWCAAWRSIPSGVAPEGAKEEDGLPGAAKNTGDEFALARAGQARRARRWLARRSFSEGGLFEN